VSLTPPTYRLERDAMTPMDALNQVLGSLDALRNLRAMALLLGTFAAAGLLLAMAESALARGAGWWGPMEAGAALTLAFYGGNAAGLLAMDDARGLPVRDPFDALRDALACAHRLILSLLVLSVGYAVLAGAAAGLLWLSRLSVAGPAVGPLLFGLAVPLSVIVIGLSLLSLLAVVAPLAAPAVWSGAGTLEVVGTLLVLLTSAVSLLAAAVGLVVSFVVMAGGRVVAELGVAVVGVDVPVQQLMAGLFGYGLRSLGATGAPTGSTGHAAAALVGGGVVFALALVLPGLVYLRGTCAVYLAMTEDAPLR